MARADFLIKRGDTLPAIRIQLINPDGSFFNPTGAVLSFRFEDVSEDPGDVVQVGAGTFSIVGDGSTGEVDYAWDATDTDTVGSFRAEVEAQPSGGGRTTFPGGSYILFDVVQDLGDA